MRLLRFLLIACLSLALSVAVATAQDTGEGIDYEAWNKVAERAEQTIGAGRASDSALIDLRSEIANFREMALAAETTNSERIETLQRQLDALGPAPDTEAGDSEPDKIAARRVELNEQLAAAQLPQVNATEAYSRADGLIAEIDAVIRARENEALLELGPSPLNPVNWQGAMTSLRDVGAALTREAERTLSSPAELTDLRNNAPMIIGLFLVGLLLTTRGRVWIGHLTARVNRRQRKRGRATLAYLVSLGQILLPVSGVVAMILAVIVSGVSGNIAEQLLGELLGFLATTFAALWLASRLFPTDPNQYAPIAVSEDLRPILRHTLIAIGVMSGLNIVLSEFVQLDQVEPASKGVFLFPFFVVLGFFFYRLGKLIHRARRDIEASEEQGEDGDFAHQEDSSTGVGLGLRILGTVGRLLMLMAVVGPLLAAVGYVNAAEALMLPTALSIGMLALLVSLQVPIRDLYAMSSGTQIEEAGDALVPVLVNLMLVVASLPVFALIWGMRTTELGEIFTRFAEGFSIGETRITPGVIFTVFLVFLLALGATRVLQATLRGSVLPRTKMDMGARNALTSGVGYVGVAIAALLAINAGGIDLTALAFILSALSVGIGFGLQNVVQNFVSGIILLIERPISEGDWIEVGGYMGIVKDISVRSTTIETFDKQQVIVPNGDFISGTVTNWTRGSQLGRAVVSVGVAYGTDTRRVEKILYEIVRESPMVMRYPEPGIDFMGFGADSLDFRIRGMLYDVNNLIAVKTELHHRIAERFAEEGIEIPFAQRDIWLRNPETLQARRKDEDGTEPPRDADPASDAADDGEETAASQPEARSSRA